MADDESLRSRPHRAASISAAGRQRKGTCYHTECGALFLSESVERQGKFEKPRRFRRTPPSDFIEVRLQGKSARSAPCLRVPEDGTKNPAPADAGAGLQRVEKAFSTRCCKFFCTEKCRKLMIQNERHPSWVSFVTIFLPVAHIFRVYRQSETPPVPGTHQTLYRSAESYASIWNIKSSSSSRVMPPNMAPRSKRSSTAATSSLRKAQPTSASDKGSSAQTDRKSP